MKNSVFFKLSILIFCAIFSCRVKKSILLPLSHSSPFVKLIAGNWKGSLPCADCSSIDYFLDLDENGYFQEQLIYNGKNENMFMKKGRWLVTEDSVLTLFENNQSYKKFRYTEGTLKMLDINGKEIQSGFEEKYKLHRESNNLKAHKFQEKLENGIDFTASGNEPFWNADVDFDKKIVFQTIDDNETISSSAPEEIEESIRKKEVYAAEITDGEIRMIVIPEMCIDNMREDTLNYSVTVELKTASGPPKKYQGCGRYLSDYRLNDVWVLTEFDNQDIDGKDFFKGKPQLEFNLERLRVWGHDGCNQLNGSFETKGSAIQFGRLISTKMACQNNPLKNEFLESLSTNTFSFSISNDKLKLSNNVHEFVFKKLD